jgi:hypothetical protein
MTAPPWATSLVRGTRATPPFPPRTRIEGDAHALAFD